MVAGMAQPIVTIGEAQAYVRIETGEEEAVLAGLIRTASALCEAFINQVVIARDFVLDLPASGASGKHRRNSPIMRACRRSTFSSPERSRNRRARRRQPARQSARAISSDLPLAMPGLVCPGASRPGPAAGGSSCRQWRE